MTIIRPAIAIGALLLSLATLACGAASDKIAEKIVEQGAGEDVDIDTNSDGDVRIKTADGEMEFSGGQSLPDDFPSDVVLIDGEIDSVNRTAVDGSLVFIITTVVDGDGAKSFDSATASMVSQGWAEASKSSGTSGGAFGGTAGYDKGERNVVISVSPASDDGRYIVTYIVTERPTGS